jgi:hypothetical protein
MSLVEVEAVSGSGTGIVTPHSTHRGVDLGGAADWYSSGDPAGIADGQQGVVSFWFRPDGGDGGLRYMIWNQGTRFQVSLTAANQLDIQGRTAGGGTVLRLTTTPTYLAGSGWHHALASWNLATPIASIYVDGAVPALGTNVALNAGNIDYTRGSWGIGSVFGGTASWWNGGLSEMFFHTVYSNIVLQATRDAWRHPNGQPPNIGADGSGPQGVQPLVYMAEVGGAFTNLGSGGAWVENGAPALSADSPKDRWVASLYQRQRRRKHYGG